MTYVKRRRSTFSKGTGYRTRLERCKDLIGRRAVLERDLTTMGGARFLIGEVLIVDSTYRGRFTLYVPGSALGRKCDLRGFISHVRRLDFHVAP